MWNLTPFLVAGVQLWQFCSALPAAAGQPVNTTSGLVTGKSSRFHPEVSEYLGIRFGETTEGQNRFMPPKRYYGNKSVDATKFGSGCVPMLSGPGGVAASILSGSQQSEDCLFVNVWTKNTAPQKKRPVMLWIYGGGFMAGDSSTSMYNGANITYNHDIVVVSFNYRIGVLGFPGAPGLDQLNPGLLDQRLAVEWTRDNIAAFGGDPARITLAGESAGATSTDYYAYAWAKDPIANGFITQSGSAFTRDLFKPAAIKSDAWFKMSEKLGCGGAATGEASLTCVKTKTVRQIMDATPGQSGSGFGSMAPSFAPTADEKTVFSDISERAKAGRFAQKPVLMGSNHNESTLFGGIASKTSLGSGPKDPEGALKLERQFRCGTAETVLGRFVNKVPAWRFLLANNKPGSQQGATHADDLPLLFGNGQSGLSKVFQDAWAAFIEDPVDGLAKHGWPKYDPQGKTLARIAPDQKLEVDFVQPILYDDFCPTSRV